MNRMMDVLPDIQASDVVLRKLVLVKKLCLHIVENHNRDLLASNCARVSIKPGEPARNKDNSSNFLKPTVKGRSIATFLLTNLGSRSAAAQGRQSLRGLPHTCRRTATTPRGVL